MSVRMRHTKGHTRNRRSHHALKAPRISACPDCGAPHLRHKMCETCGKYRGKQVVDVMAKIEKKNARIKAKAKELGIDPSEAKEEEKPLSADELSKKPTKKTKK